jgi:hypothetical protein
MAQQTLDDQMAGLLGEQLTHFALFSEWIFEGVARRVAHIEI